MVSVAASNRSPTGQEYTFFPRDRRSPAGLWLVLMRPEVELLAADSNQQLAEERWGSRKGQCLCRIVTVWFVMFMLLLSIDDSVLIIYPLNVLFCLAIVAGLSPSLINDKTFVCSSVSPLLNPNPYFYRNWRMLVRPTGSYLDCYF